MRDNENFLPIPSLKNQYEINRAGVVRNTKTKHILQTVVSVKQDGKYISKSTANLLWEVHGKRRKDAYQKNIPVSCQKDKEKYFFQSYRECAKFLSGKVNYAQSTITGFLRHHKGEIGGWKIGYHDEPT